MHLTRRGVAEYCGKHGRYTGWTHKRSDLRFGPEYRDFTKWNWEGWWPCWGGWRAEWQGQVPRAGAVRYEPVPARTWAPCQQCGDSKRNVPPWGPRGRSGGPRDANARLLPPYRVPSLAIRRAQFASRKQRWECIWAVWCPTGDAARIPRRERNAHGVPKTPRPAVRLRSWAATVYVRPEYFPSAGANADVEPAASVEPTPATTTTAAALPKQLWLPRVGAAAWLSVPWICALQEPASSKRTT